MPLGSRSETASSVNGNRGQDRPILFQKYFKSGGRTYAIQIKVSQNNKRYMVLTEGVRDPETQQVKKHTICVFDQDLKEFFAMLQETVLYLRSTRDPGSSVAGMPVARPNADAPKPPTVKVAASSAKVSAKAAKPVMAKPAPQQAARGAKPGYRAASQRGGR